jgi:putative membrane protein
MGSSISEHFGWHRNHYDRLVHFASGVLGVPIASEVLQRVTGLQPRGAAVISISVVVSIGAAYEIVEWQLAVWLSPMQAEAYNGQQGDIWDPQKDLALAALGSILSAAAFFRKSFSTELPDECRK